jgi:hypothetical protein
MPDTWDLVRPGLVAELQRQWNVVERRLAMERADEFIAALQRAGVLRSVTAGGGAADAAMIVLPIAVFIGGCYALFYMPYADAQDAYRTEETQSGYTHALVAALIGWEWRHVSSRFKRQYIRINVVDEEMNKIRVVAYNLGLVVGYSIGKALPPDVAKAILRSIRKVANEPIPAVWDRLSQISYVITLGAAARRSGIIPRF